jgi:hypothetical protein
MRSIHGVIQWPIAGLAWAFDEVMNAWVALRDAAEAAGLLTITVNRCVFVVSSTPMLA